MNTEVEKFDKINHDWWNLNSSSVGILHKFNLLRVPYIKKYTNSFDISILDVGCGGGILAEGLYDVGFSNIIAIDLAQNSIKIATERALHFGKKITYKTIDINDIDEQFDVVICSEVLEHVNNINLMLKAIYDKTKVGGLIFISTINKTIKSFFETIVAPEYILNIVDKKTHTFNKFVKPSDITNILSKCKILDIKGVSYSIIDKNFYFREDINSNYFIILQK